MASEDNSYFTEDEFIFKKTQLSDRKTQLSLQLQKLIEDKEAFDSEILKLNNTLTRSKEERIFLIQSINHSNCSTFERRPTSHSIPFLPSDDEDIQQINDEMSPESKRLNSSLSKDEDYIEKRGRKPKTLRVSIPISQIELPAGATIHMNRARGKYKKSLKKHSIHSNNTHLLPYVSNNGSNSINSTTQVSCLPHINNSSTDANVNSLPHNPHNASDLVLLLKTADSKQSITPIELPIYLQKGTEQEFKEDSVVVSENQSPNSKLNKSLGFSNRIEEEIEKMKDQTL